MKAGINSCELSHHLYTCYQVRGRELWPPFQTQVCENQFRDHSRKQNIEGTEKASDLGQQCYSLRFCSFREGGGLFFSDSCDFTGLTRFRMQDHEPLYICS